MTTLTLKVSKREAHWGGKFCTVCAMGNVLNDYIIPSNSIHLYTKMNAYMYIWTNINDILIILMHIYIKYIFDIYIYITLNTYYYTFTYMKYILIYEYLHTYILYIIPSSYCIRIEWSIISNIPICGYLVLYLVWNKVYTQYKHQIINKFK